MSIYGQSGEFSVPNADKIFPFFDKKISGHSGVADADARARIEAFVTVAS
jgi:hypothetical protein